MQTSKEIIIFGAGETAHLAYEYFTHDSDYQVVAFSVDPEYVSESEFLGLPIVSSDEITNRFPPNAYGAFVAVSSGKLNRVRKSVYDRVKLLGYGLVSYVSTRAFVWHNVAIGENCFILEDNTLQPFVEIGNNVVLWSGNHVGHRSVIRDHCFVSSHCVISGFCTINESCFLGVNCTLENNLEVREDNFIGAGAIVRKSTSPRDFYQEDKTSLAKIDTHRLFKL
ncbi:MAG: acetyltransferase [Oceanospirillales bacterium]|nr:acetyltransferase [Oceanospirillales bacterium]